MNSKQLLVAAFVLPVFASPAFAQVASQEYRVSVSASDRTVEDWVTYIRRGAGTNIVVIDPKDGEKISDVKVSLDLNEVPWRDALEILAEKAHGFVEERTGGILALTRPIAVRIDFENEDIRKVLNDIARAASANVVFGNEVTGNVSVRFNDVPWQEAFEVTARSIGFVVVRERYGVLRVVSPNTLKDEMITRTYQLRYLRPKGRYEAVIKSEFVAALATGAVKTGDVTKTFSLLVALQKALSESGKMDYIDTSNVLIVTDTPQVQLSIKDMIARLDIEPLQVFCDVKFVSTANTDILNLGIDYGDSGPMASLSGSQVPVTFPFDPGYGGFEDLIIASPNGHGPYIDSPLDALDPIFPPTVFGALSFTSFNATLRLLQRDTKTEVIQAPKLMALDGNEATIFVGETIRYAEARSEQGQAGGLQLSISEAGGSPVEVGFQLLIRPHVIPGTEKIVMDVIPKETSLSGTGSSELAPAGFDVFTIGASGLEGSIALPRTRSSTIVTSMLIESGQTAAIGGLSTEAKIERHTEVPFLASIPILGELFQHDNNVHDRRSLMVFLTPRIVRSSADTEAMFQLELERRRVNLHDQLEQLLKPASEKEAPK